MKIKEYLGCLDEDIKNKKFNIFIGISLDNKYFNKSNISKYIEWGLKYTKDSLLILVVDEVNTVNYKIFKGLNDERASMISMERGLEKKLMIDEVISQMKGVDRDKIKVIRWDSVKKMPFYIENMKLFFDFFSKDNFFRESVINVVKSNLGDRAKSLSISELEELSKYVLWELPVALNGVKFQGISYNLFPYPKKSYMELLISDLREGKKFNNFFSTLNIDNPTFEVIATV